MKKLIVCDYPSKYTFPSFGFGSSEKRIWHLAKTASELENFQVILTGPLWLTEYVPRAFHFEPRLGSRSAGEFLERFGKADYLFGGHEYFDKDEYVIPFTQVARKLVSYQLHPYEYIKIAFDGRDRHLFCYSQEMVEKYKVQNPRQHLLFHSGVDEEPYFTKVPKPYLIWMGRLDRDKAPHYAVLAASKLGMPLYLLGKSIYQPEYEQIYRDTLNQPVVRRFGVVFGPEKMKLLSEAICGIYTLDSEYTEAGAGVLGEMLSSGIPIAGITWKGNDAVCAAVDDYRLGKIIKVDKTMNEDDIADQLAEAISYCLALERETVFELGRRKFDPAVLVRTMFEIVEGSR